MSSTTIILFGFVGLFALILLQVPIGVAMMVSGAAGFAAIVGVQPALSMFGGEVASSFASADLALIPIFLLMGNFASAAGLSTDLYRLADAFVGHRRGGLALATLGGCAGFGALCGSSLATVGTMHRVAYPEMLARGYPPHFAAGTIAVGGTLGILVPPSIILVVYSVLAETFVIDLYIAALLPALMAVVFYGVAVILYGLLRRDAMPAGPRLSWAERLVAVRQSLFVIALASLVIGGIYAGVFTALEAASVGAVLSFSAYLLRRGWQRAEVFKLIGETASVTGMIYVMVIGASAFNYFVTVSGVADLFMAAVNATSLPPWGVIAMILVVYIVLGAFFDEVATMLITLPFVLPLIVSWGYDPLWWGIVNVTVIMIGLFCPPIGLNVMVMHGLVRNVPLRRMYVGVLPFLLADFLRLGLLVAFPLIATWLPTALR
ncbi:MULTISPECIES: TRAP transporter large permease [unclassified Hydrogenophaga]|uniref:TRAP transporter large permease n=1 Tax=unclassified Hydrogenophaga TaxID=2610897 RepID=UPI0009621B12|nr:MULTISPECIES: TRAP transporter large permease [unclassified Hydrogenophaga]MBN9370058.1 TRAP transporter large permease [Hydrogenophaga sp.]OJV48254.1 MAG: C4-dicarboxylate ABC transporter permease [Hydrogenophaga sp. 70-12]